MTAFLAAAAGLGWLVAIVSTVNGIAATMAMYEMSRRMREDARRMR